MTSPDLIAFIRSKLPNSFWDFHGPDIVKAVEKFEKSVRGDERRFVDFVKPMHDAMDEEEQ